MLLMAYSYLDIKWWWVVSFTLRLP